MWEFLGNVVLAALLFFILYWVVRWAIDHSKAAKNLEVIKTILVENHLEQEDAATGDRNLKMAITFNNICPACHSPIKENLKFCTSCGTKLQGDEP